MKRVKGILILSVLVFVAGCGGGSGDGSTTTAASTTATATTTAVTATATDASIFGIVDKISVATAKPIKKAGAAKTAASPVAGAAVTAIKSDGTSVGSTTTAQDGTYTLLLPKNGTYVIKITSGNVVMKSVYSVGTADTTINVNPGTTAATVILEQKLGTSLESGTAFGTAVNGVDVNASVTAIATTAEFATTANAVVAAVAAGVNPLTDATVIAAATTAATTASVASLVGKWMPTTYTTGGVTTTPDKWQTLEFTANTLNNGYGVTCPKVGSYTTSGNTISTTVTIGGAAGCEPVGNTSTLTYSIAGNILTLSGTDYSTGAAWTGTLTKLSADTTIVRYITDAPWVAYQIGNGAWTAAASTDTGTVKAYTFDVGSPTAKFGVANACDAFQSKIWQLTRGEAWDRLQMCNNAQITVAGTVTGITGGNNAVVFIGGKWGSSQFGIVNGGAFSLGIPLTGIYDIVAVEYDPLMTLSKILIQRDVVIGSATSGLTLDLANGVALVSRSVTVTGPTVNTKVYYTMQIQTKNGTWVDLSPLTNAAASGSPISLLFPPASAMVAGEVFLLTGSYNISGFFAPITAEKVLDATVDPGNTTTLDPSAVTPISGVTVSSGTHPTIGGLSYTKAASSPAFQDFWLRISGISADRNIEISALWLGTATTYTVPDFTGIGTWDPAWELTSGTVSVQADAEMGNNGYLSWKNGGNDTPGDSGAATEMVIGTTLKPQLYGPRISMRRD